MAGGWLATGHNQVSITLHSHTHTGGHHISDNNRSPEADKVQITERQTGVTITAPARP